MESEKTGILELTEQLCSFKTTKGRLRGIENCLDFIEEYFSDSCLEVERYEKEGTPSLVITYNGNPDPEVMLHGHIDVVEGPEEIFEPEIRDGKIFGRGTADMKSGVAALMKLMKDKKSEQPDIGLMIVTDEEVGGFNGAKYLVENSFYSPEFVISAEPNNTGGYLKIISKQKGVIRAEISAEGKNAHGSRPWNGENAAEKLWEKYFELKKNFSTDKEEWDTTVNLGRFDSGEAVNVVPGKAEAQLDIRYTKSYPPEEVEKDLENIEGLSYSIKSVDPMLDTDSENDYVQVLKEASESVTGDEVDITRKEPASDVRHFSEHGIPGVVFGPEGYNVHEDREYAVIDSFDDYYRCLTEFIRKIT